MKLSDHDAKLLAKLRDIDERNIDSFWPEMYALAEQLEDKTEREKWQSFSKAAAIREKCRYDR